MSALEAIEQWLTELGYIKIKLSSPYLVKTYKRTRAHIVLMNPDGRVLSIWDSPVIRGEAGRDHDLVIGWSDTPHFEEVLGPSLCDPEFFTWLKSYFHL